MKLAHGMGLAAGAVGAFAALALAGSVWLGCSGDDTSAPAEDASAKDTGPSGTDSGPGGNDAATQADGGGDGGAGPSCDTYCATIMANCTGALAQYQNNGDCLKECALFAPGATGDTSGDTLGCRAWHAGEAQQNAALHCPHAGPYGGAACGSDRCAPFCAIAVAFCGDAGGPWTSPSSCMTDCMKFTLQADAGESATGPASGDTLNCREYHLQNAIDTPTPHCGHIGPVPDSGPFPCK